MIAWDDDGDGPDDYKPMPWWGIALLVLAGEVIAAVIILVRR